MPFISRIIFNKIQNSFAGKCLLFYSKEPNAAIRGLKPQNNLIRFFKSNSILKAEKKDASAEIKKQKKSFKWKAMGSTGITINMGKGILGGVSLFGISALCYYGIRLEEEAIKRGIGWPAFIRERIKDTYKYFGGSLVFTGLGLLYCLKSPPMLRMVTKHSFLTLIGSIAAMMGTGFITTFIPYYKDIGVKQLFWAIHTSTIGGILAPLCFIGGPFLFRAVILTAGCIGSLSAIAYCAPSEKFLQRGGILGVSLGLVFASSLSTWIIPPSTILGASIFSFVIYGGAILFAGLLLLDSKNVINTAEDTPIDSPYDPINASISIYSDSINIFARLVKDIVIGKQSKF